MPCDSMLLLLNQNVDKDLAFLSDKIEEQKTVISKYEEEIKSLRGRKSGTTKKPSSSRKKPSTKTNSTQKVRKEPHLRKKLTQITNKIVGNS